MSIFSLFAVGPRNYTPLSENAILVSGNTDWFARWCCNYREVGKEQTKANHIWTGREASKGAEGCQICWMLSTNAGMDIECWIGEWCVLLVHWLMGTHHVYCFIMCDLGIALCTIYVHTYLIQQLTSCALCSSPSALNNTQLVPWVKNFCYMVLQVLFYMCLTLFPERIEECFWWSNSGCVGAPRTSKEEKVRPLVNFPVSSRPG